MLSCECVELVLKPVTVVLERLLIFLMQLSCLLKLEIVVLLEPADQRILLFNLKLEGDGLASLFLQFFLV